MIYRDKEWFIEQYTNKQRTLKDMAEEAGVAVGTIHVWRVRHGIEKLHRTSDNNTVVEVQCKHCKEDFETTLRYVWRRVRDEGRTYFFCDTDCYFDNIRGKPNPSKGLKREDNPMWKGGVSGINEYLRDSLGFWKHEVMKEQEYKCFISEEEIRDFHIHHATSFHELRDKAMIEMGLTYSPTIADYDLRDLEKLKQRIIELHEHEKGYVMRADLHQLFHSLYGFKTDENNLLEFKTRYRLGEFNERRTIT